MSRLLIASVDRFGPIQEEVRESLAACSTTVARAGAGQMIVRRGAPSQLRTLASGLAVRQTTLGDGGRQILGFVTPGDLLDLSGLFTGADHEVVALSACEVRQTTARELRSMLKRHSNLLAALCRAVMTEAKLQRNWIIGLGRRTAAARTANLFCEVYARQKIVGLTQDGACGFPAVQADIADALGLSVVHTNRVLQALRRSGLAALRDGVLTIEDWDRLATLGEFDAQCFLPEQDPAERAARNGQVGECPAPGERS